MMMITHTFIVIVTHSDIEDDYDVDVDAKSATLKDLSKSEKLWLMTLSFVMPCFLYFPLFSVFYYLTQFIPNLCELSSIAK